MLNYNHLYYFYHIARLGSITRASEALRISQPSLSIQLKDFENSLQRQLFIRKGRKLEISEDGKLVYEYARKMFGLSEEMKSLLDGRSVQTLKRFRVGIIGGLPKLIAYRILEPVRQTFKGIRIECYIGDRGKLLGRLANHKIDLVLSDAPYTSDVAVKAYNHSIGESPIGFFGSAKFKKKFSIKTTIESTPLLLPAVGSMIRREVDLYFEKKRIRPLIVGEFNDVAMMKSFAIGGHGVTPLPISVRDDVKKIYNLHLLDTMPGAKEQFFAISLERVVKHPAIELMIAKAIENL